MELNKELIHNLDTITIFKEIIPYLNNIYESFNYLDLSKEDFNKIVIEEINITKNEYNGETKYINYISNKIKLVIINLLKEKVKVYDDMINIINNYINNNFDLSMSTNEIIKNFKILEQLLLVIGVNIEPKLLMELINNNNMFSSIIEGLFKKYKSFIVFLTMN